MTKNKRKRIRAGDVIAVLLILLFISNIVTVIVAAVTIGKANTLIRNTAQEAAAEPSSSQPTVYTSVAENGDTGPRSEHRGGGDDHRRMAAGSDRHRSDRENALGRVPRSRGKGRAGSRRLVYSQSRR